MKVIHDGWEANFQGRLSSDVYSTAWVALVPALNHPDKPAWPQTLQFLRDRQLPDGGWGEASVLYAHERTIATVAAIRALTVWNLDPEDRLRVERGLEALRRYAPMLQYEPCESIGFELLLPRIWHDTEDQFGQVYPVEYWKRVEDLNAHKLALIVRMQPQQGRESAWWFSLECLPEQGLAVLDETVIAPNGSVATSPAATAAYLWAKRRAGVDVPVAEQYLDGLIQSGDGGVPFAHPIEIFERLWVLDNFRRAGMKPSLSLPSNLLERVAESWRRFSPGLSFTDEFPVNDGDSTSVGLTVLWWGGYGVSEESLLDLWDTDHVRSYPEERGASVSANVHALTALRSQYGMPHEAYARKVTDWLMQGMAQDGVMPDKWHLSPLYASSRVLPAFGEGWCPEGFKRSLDVVLESQRETGGWGWFKPEGTVEETALCLLGLGYAWETGQLSHIDPLIRGVRFLTSHMEDGGAEALWIGKTLYRSDVIVRALVGSALFGMRRILRQADVVISEIDLDLVA